jgi:hypothetical protein
MRINRIMNEGKRRQINKNKSKEGGEETEEAGRR